MADVETSGPRAEGQEPSMIGPGNGGGPSPWHSLSGRLALGFTAVSLLGVVLVVWIVRQSTVSEFDRLVLVQAREGFVADALAYYGENASWAGVRGHFREIARRSPSAAWPPPPMFPLADAGGAIVLPAAGYAVGERVEPDALASGVPLVVDGTRIGTVLTVGETPPLGVQEARFLARTNRAALLAAGTAAAVALAMAVFLARRMTRPVRELTEASRALAAGDLGRVVPVRSRDELGELAAAFNQMSRDVARASRLRRQMAADIAHDLRTPLTVVAGYTEAMRDGVLQPTAKRLDSLHAEVERLLRLVEDLRTLSLADAGELRLERRDTSPVTLLEHVAATHAEAAARSGVALAVRSEPDLPPISVDAAHMTRVLANLVQNALRHTAAGGHVTLEATAGRESVRLVVRDDGGGIAPEHLAHVFDRLYRADAARTHGGEATGLGLAIAKSVVEAHGGRISARSEPGRGSVFTVRLPVV